MTHRRRVRSHLVPSDRSQIVQLRTPQIAGDRGTLPGYIPDVRIKVCLESELVPGGAKVVKILAKRMAVFNVAGRLFGLEADCKHMKASIATGRIEGLTIVCPVHGWQYDLETGACLNEPWASLKTYAVIVEAGQIYLDTE
jgi:nitrite reductase (NADH) small subunit